MNNKDFDDILRKKLADFQIDDKQSDWDVFKDLWHDQEEDLSGGDDQVNEALDEDREFDQKIKNHLENLRLPFNSQHWVILRGKLEAEAIFKKRLYFAKIIELSFLCLLVMLVFKIWPVQKEIYHLPIYDVPMVTSVPIVKSVDQTVGKKKNTNLNKKIKSSAKSTLDVSSFDMQSDLQKESISPIHFLLENNLQTKSGTTGTIQSDEQHSRINTNIENNDQAGAHNSVIDHAMIAIVSIPSVGAIIDIPNRPIGYPDLTPPLVKVSDKENNYIDFAVGPRLNLVNSPFDPVYKIDPYLTINTNFNVVARIEKSVGPVKLYTGLGYTNISYQPKIVKERYAQRESEYSETSLENIKFKTFNIPVGVKYEIVKNKNFNMYASAGINVNFIAESEYTIIDKPLGRLAPSAPPSITGSANENTKLSQKTFSSGIIEGGNVKDNLYASANIGLGFMRTFNSGVGIFVEPRYNHYLSAEGIGPNADKVHALSVDVGARFLLN